MSTAVELGHQLGCGQGCCLRQPHILCRQPKSAKSKRMILKQRLNLSACSTAQHGTAQRDATRRSTLLAGIQWCSTTHQRPARGSVLLTSPAVQLIRRSLLTALSLTGFQVALASRAGCAAPGAWRLWPQATGGYRAGGYQTSPSSTSPDSGVLQAAGMTPTYSLRLCARSSLFQHMNRHCKSSCRQAHTEQHTAPQHTTTTAYTPTWPASCLCSCPCCAPCCGPCCGLCCAPCCGPCSCLCCAHGCGPCCGLGCGHACGACFSCDHRRHAWVTTARQPEKASRCQKGPCRGSISRQATGGEFRGRWCLAQGACERSKQAAPCHASCTSCQH